MNIRVTLMVAQHLSGHPVWMANPSSINKEKNQIIFAHCTIPTKMISDKQKADLTTNMESGLCTVIRGPLKISEITLLRINSSFNKLKAGRGKIEDSDTRNENFCRTQAVVSIEGSVENWIEPTFGNHHVIVYGDITMKLIYFCDFTKIELIQKK